MYYFDFAYIVKCYLNDPDSEAVQDMVRTPLPLYSSALCSLKLPVPFTAAIVCGN